jgi:hypothetical protein
MEELDELLQRVYNGDKNFTEDELSELAMEFKQFDLIKGEYRRWSRTMETILNIKDKYFSIKWESGLTERQEDEFYNQPKEVELIQKEITTTVNTYNNINKQ